MRSLTLLTILVSSLFPSQSRQTSAPGLVLQYGTPESVSLLPEPFQELEENITAYLTPANYGAATFNQVRPIYPGATVIVGHQNTIVSHFAVGQSLKYADVNGTELPAEQQIATAKDTIYDMASLTKMFITIVVLQQIERGTIALNATVATYLPDFAKNEKGAITLLMLLTHTSGFDADPVPDLWTGYSTYSARKTAIIEQAIINPPGKKYLYSDLNFMTLQFVLEQVTSLPLDTLIHDQFTSPLGMVDTFFNRGNLDDPDGVNAPVDAYSRIAVTEFQIAALGPREPARPQPVRAQVHDENAWSLNGVAGHAGIFSTAKDLAIFCQMILNNGTYGSTRILQSSTVDLIFHNFNGAFPGNAHGLGFELDQFYWAGAMQGPSTAGHTGYTGTSMVIDRPSGTFFVLLSHRVHPSRTWSSPNIVRQMVGNFVAKALGRKVSV